MMANLRRYFKQWRFALRRIVRKGGSPFVYGEGKGHIGDGTFNIGSRSRLIRHATAQIRSGAHFEIRDGGIVTLGENVVIGMNNWIQGNGGVTIGKDTIIGPNTVLLSTMHQTFSDNAIQSYPLRKAFLDIGDDVFIGANCTVAAGISLGKGSIISSNSFVNSPTEPYCIYGGVPAKLICKRGLLNICSKGLAVIATGNRDRNNIYGTWTNLLIDISHALLKAGIDLNFVVHPNSKGDAERRISPDKLFIRENHSDFAQILESVKPDFIILWNGGTEGDELTVGYANEFNIEIIYGEMAWLPQKQFIHFDTKGVNANSSVRDLDLNHIVTDIGFTTWRDAYLEALAIKPPPLINYVFVPLQDEKDTNIYKYSPFKDMEEFVRYLHGKIRDKIIVVRPHPRGQKFTMKDFDNVIIRRDGGLYDWVFGAEMIIGINSTVLVEALLTDKPVFGVGEGLLTGLGAINDVIDLDHETFSATVTSETLSRRAKLLSYLVFNKQIDRRKATWLCELENKTPFKKFMAKK